MDKTKVAIKVDTVDQAEEVVKWEYKESYRVNDTMRENWGNEGWEAYAVVDHYTYFKRPKQ